MVVFSLTGWSPFLPSGFLVSRRTPDSARYASAFTYGNFTLCVIPSQVFRLAFTLASSRSLPLTYFYIRFGLFRFRSPLLSESLLFSSPPGTKMFQFPGFSSRNLCIQLWIATHFRMTGFPHSDTPGSLSVYDSPRRFAVFCVLLLLYMPRHPPYALLRLITSCLRTVNYF